MHFLRENITPRKTVSNLQDQLEVNEDVADVGNQPSETSAQLTPEKCIFPVENTPSSSKMKKKRSAPLEDELPSNCLAELKQPRQHNASDADSVFSQYVCNQLKNIPEGYNKEMLKLEIQQMIVKSNENEFRRKASKTFENEQYFERNEFSSNFRSCYCFAVCEKSRLSAKSRAKFRTPFRRQ